MEIFSGCAADCNQCLTLFTESGACAEMHSPNGVSDETLMSIPFSCFGSCMNDMFLSCSDVTNTGSVGKDIFCMLIQNASDVLFYIKIALAVHMILNR